jgi:hypothetical protein
MTSMITSNNIPIRSKSSGYNVESSPLSETQNILSASVPMNNMQRGQSELSASLMNPSTLEGYKSPNPNQYRNIKARYFQSLNLSSPLQKKVQNDQTSDVTKPEEPEEKQKPAEPITIKVKSPTTPTRIRRATIDSPTSSFGGFPPAPFVQQKSTEPVAIKKPPRQTPAIKNSVQFKNEGDTDTDTEQDESSTGSFEDTFMFDNIPTEKTLRLKQKHFAGRDSEEGKSYTPVCLYFYNH